MSAPARVAVVGGSLGGLSAALALRDAGCDVEVYERSRVPLEGRGAGIVLHPATVRYVVEHGLRPLAELSAAAHWVRYLDDAGSVAHQVESRFRFTSYHALHRELLAVFPGGRYHLGSEVVGIAQHADDADVALAGGDVVTCELVVFADGIHSLGRRLLAPRTVPRYAGYVGWRGTVVESELTPETSRALEEAVSYYVRPFSHMLAYPIPAVDGSLEPGRRLTNWVWYRNVPEGAPLADLLTDREGTRRVVSVGPGLVADRHVDELREAAERDLPWPLAELVLKSREPFVQAVVDVEAERMAFGRACLVGDAAFALRPHVAAGTAKAADDAWTLGEAVAAADGDVLAALRRWEPGRLALGRQAFERTRRAGDRSQLRDEWRIGDPLPFGLREDGDSSLE